MGRLIDEDDVISLLTNHHFDDDKENFDLLLHNLCKEVKCIPTAYDVDAVEKRLKSQKEVWNDKEISDARLVEEKRKAYDMAIKIVKGGVVDAKTNS
jgi:hypothetical protein